MIVKGGVYQIKNIVNDKVYIGSAVDFNKRKAAHFYQLRSNKHHCKHLQSSYNLYGETSFVFEILHEVETRKELVIYEQCWIDYARLEGIELYNILLHARSMLGYKHTQETIQKQRIRMLGNKHTLGYKHNVISINKMKSRVRKPLSIETKQRLRTRNLGRKQPLEEKIKQSLAQMKPILQVDKDTGSIIRKWNSIKEAETTLNITGGISKACRGKMKTIGGYKWRYADVT